MGLVERRARPHDRGSAPARFAQRRDPRRAVPRRAVRRPYHRRRGGRRRGDGAAAQPLSGRRPARCARAGAWHRWPRRAVAGARRVARGALRRRRRPVLRTAAARGADRVADRRRGHRDRRRRRGDPVGRHHAAGPLPRGQWPRRRRVDAGRDDAGRPGAHPRRQDRRPPRRRGGGCRGRRRPAPDASAGHDRPRRRDGVPDRRCRARRRAQLARRRHLAVDRARRRRTAGPRLRAHLAARDAGGERVRADGVGRRGAGPGRCRRRGGRVSRARRGAAGGARSRGGRSRRRRAGRRRAARRRRSPAADPRAAGRRR
jgi:hypothetical protein